MDEKDLTKALVKLNRLPDSERGVSSKRLMG
jgi:hypothetical protein